MKVIPYSELLNLKSKENISYQDLLFTDEWKTKRDEIVVRDGKRCSSCDYGETGSFAHYDEKTKTYSYITEDGKEDIRYFRHSNGEIEKQSVPRIIVTDKPYFLHVHHKYYVYNQLPWQYDNVALITLCNWCHSKVHANEKIVMYDNLDLIKYEELISCDRCDGAGWFQEYSHVSRGVCFKCEGKRFLSDLIKY